MKLIENYLSFIQSAKINQEPYSYKLYNANPETTIMSNRELFTLYKFCKNLKINKANPRPHRRLHQNSD
jgi:hypothetical protein